MKIESSCLLWTGTILKNGYGMTSNRNYAHRIAYIKAKGPIPDGYDIDHLCRNRACCNPDHLEAVTRKENLRRGLGFKVSDAQAEEIRTLYATGEYSTRQLATKTGISKSQIHLLTRGRRR